MNDDYGLDGVAYTGKARTTTADLSVAVSFLDKNGDVSSYDLVVDTGRQTSVLMFASTFYNFSVSQDLPTSRSPYLIARLVG